MFNQNCSDLATLLCGLKVSLTGLYNGILSLVEFLMGGLSRYPERKYYSLNGATVTPKEQD